VGRRVVSDRYDRRVSEPAETTETETEVVDGLPVLATPQAVQPAQNLAPVAVQAAAAAGAGLAFGAALIAALRGRRARRSAIRVGGGRRRRRRNRIDVVGTRSFLVDVHFVERR
jgi:hypothetical protein